VQRDGIVTALNGLAISDTRGAKYRKCDDVQAHAKLLPLPSEAAIPARSGR
jgi:hypothetical protein